MQYSGKALAKRFDQEMRATGLNILDLEGISNKRVYAARKVLDEETFLEFVYYSVIARMACGAMSVNAIQFMYAALDNGDTTRYDKGHSFDAELKRLRELVPLYPAWKVTELMQERRAKRHAPNNGSSYSRSRSRSTLEESRLWGCRTRHQGPSFDG